MSKSITRHTVNEQQYNAPAFSKSGFPIGYRRYSSYALGRLHVSGYQNVMPGDKISGQNKGNFTLKRIVTPMVSDIDVSQYNLFIPFRALDRTFERAFAPSKNNGMSASWSAPTVSTRYLVEQIIKTYYYGFDDQDFVFFTYIFNDNLYSSLGHAPTVADFISKYNTDFSSSISISDLYTRNVSYPFANLIGHVITNLTQSYSGNFRDMASKLYLDDALLDIANNISVKLGSAENPIITGSMLLSEFGYLLLDCLLTPFIGRYSYYGEFNYKFVRPSDLYKIRKFATQGDYTDITDFIGIFDNTPLSEYPLRAMYVIWYEKFRNVNLEPENSDLPYWRDFGSTSIFDISNGGNLCYLLYRIRPWYEDMFTTAQVDDLSRHVWAPIVSLTETAASYHINADNNLDTNSDHTLAPGFLDDYGAQKPATYVISWFDQVSGFSRKITCPVPTNINDVLASTDLTAADVYGLDLNTLRQSQQLERYLKRNYLFGDEYQDRMLAHYNSRVSDLRINRPELISQSINNANFGQEIANMSNGISEAGDRTATGTLTCSGDDFTMFAEEFGILIHLLTFMPLASYDGIQPQLLSTKVVDYPLPEFATNNEEFGRKMEIADSALDSAFIGTTTTDNSFMFGRYPAYHAWRQRIDQVGGDFLNEMQDCTFRRFFGLESEESTPKLNYYFIHCRPNLGMFANTNLYDMQIYGDVVHECYVERVLPTPVESI